MHEDILSALKALNQGGIILYPTDTIWGIGCDATNEEAVKRVYDIKQRKDAKSMLILLDNADNLVDYVEDVPDIAYNLIDITNKPLTIIYPGAKNVAKSLIAEDGSIGIRIVDDEFCRQLIRKLGKPIVSTSANISGNPWPPNYSKVDKKIIRAMDYIVSWKQHEVKRGTPSGIIKLGPGSEIKIIRE
jgi:L-threonylcarbamoyladenylate synthase